MVPCPKNVKPPILAVPPGVDTTTSPDPPVPNTASIVEASLTTKEAAAIPPKVTPEALVKLVPVSVILSPAAPAEADREEIVGAGTTGTSSSTVFLQAKEVTKQALANLKGSNHDQSVGVDIVLRAIEAPLRSIVENAGGEASVVVNKVAEGTGNFGRSEEHTSELQSH